MQPLHYAGRVPTLIRLRNCAITMYAADHQPPHFHVRTHDGREALVVLDDFSVLSGSVSRRELADALQWAKGNAELLAAKWQELNP